MVNYYYINYKYILLNINRMFYLTLNPEFVVQTLINVIFTIKFRVVITGLICID